MVMWGSFCLRKERGFFAGFLVFDVAAIFEWDAEESGKRKEWNTRGEIERRENVFIETQKEQDGIASDAVILFSSF